MTTVAEPRKVVTPFDAVREQIERLNDPRLTDGERAAMVRLVAHELEDLRGLLGRYVGDEELRQMGMFAEQQQTLEQVRELADIREELIDRHLATAEECDALGLLSHTELVHLAEEGLLSEALAGSELLRFNALHPHGRGGKWIETLSRAADALRSNLRSKKPPDEPLRPRAKRAVSRSKVSRDDVKKAAAETPVGKLAAKLGELKHGESHQVSGTRMTVSRHGGDFRVHEDGAQRDLAGSAEHAASVVERYRKASSEEYQRRSKKLNKRVEKRVRSAGFTPAEHHFNDGGKVSQRALAQYVDQAATQPKTVDLYSRDDGEGGRVWDESRRELHERIIDSFLRKRRWDETAENGKGAWVLDPEGEELQPHPDGPKVLFSGGGYAAGKGGVLKLLGARGDLPPDSFTLDPDQVKAELPEYQKALADGDPEGNMRVYQEAWEIAQEIQARAQDKGLNVVVDGISDTSPDEMIARAQSFTDRGYQARVVYVDIPTEEALKRAANRAQNAQSDSDKRMIPEVIMRSVHRDVAATVPNLIAAVRDKGLPLHIEVWDNDQGKDEHGSFRPPLRFASYDPDKGQEEIENAALWERLRKKGYEEIMVKARRARIKKTMVTLSRDDSGEDVGEPLVEGEEETLMEAAAVTGRMLVRERVGSSYAPGSKWEDLGIEFPVIPSPGSVPFQTAMMKVKAEGKAWVVMDAHPRRYHGKCKQCKQPVTALVHERVAVGTRHEYGHSREVVERSPLSTDLQPSENVSVGDNSIVRLTCPRDGEKVWAQPLKGKFSVDVPCDARCTNAKGPNCECSCGGMNHGSAFGV